MAIEDKIFQELKSDIYYNGEKLLRLKDEEGEDPNIYFSLSARSFGKTTWFYNFLMLRSLYLDERFILLTRNKLDINGVCQNFVNSYFMFDVDVANFKVVNLADGVVKQIWYGDKIIGHCLGLTSSNKLKTISKLLEVDIGYTFFDEFIVEKGSFYLNNEVYKLQSILQSIYRNKPYKLICAANLVSSICPIFSQMRNSNNYDITDLRTLHPEAKKLRGIGWVLMISEQSQELQHILTHNNRAFGASEYFAMSMSSDFNDDMTMIDKTLKKDKRTTVFYLTTDDDTYKLSVNKKGYYYFEEYKKDIPLGALTYTLTQKNIGLAIYVSNNPTIRNQLRDIYDNGLVFFDKITSKFEYVQYIKY